MIRAFVGLEVPDTLVGTLIGAQSGLTLGSKVAPENLHVTLTFLDSQPENKLQDLDELLSDIRQPPFTLTLSGLDVFGTEMPRTLFANVTPVEPLKALRKSVVRAARDAGIQTQSERFRPHVTLARFGNGLAPDEAPALARHLARRSLATTGEAQIVSFALWRSRLGKDGANYDILARYPLL